MKNSCSAAGSPNCAYERAAEPEGCIAIGAYLNGGDVVREVQHITALSQEPDASLWITRDGVVTFPLLSHGCAGISSSRTSRINSPPSGRPSVPRSTPKPSDCASLAWSLRPSRGARGTLIRRRGRRPSLELIRRIGAVGADPGARRRLAGGRPGRGAAAWGMTIVPLACDTRRRSRPRRRAAQRAAVGPASRAIRAHDLRLRDARRRPSPRARVGRDRIRPGADRNHRPRGGRPPRPRAARARRRAAGRATCSGTGWCPSSASDGCASTAQRHRPAVAVSRPGRCVNPRPRGSWRHSTRSTAPCGAPLRPGRRGSRDAGLLDPQARGRAEASAAKAPLLDERDDLVDRDAEQLGDLCGRQIARAGGRVIGHVTIMAAAGGGRLRGIPGCG